MTPLIIDGSPGFERKRNGSVSIPLTFDTKENDSYEPQSHDIGEQLDADNPSWRSLFSFTQKSHCSAAIIAVVWSVAAGATHPITAIIYGKIFTEMTRYGSGNLSDSQLLGNVAVWCSALAILGGGAWIVQGASLSSWMIFGELQAKCVRAQIFSSMLDKELEWYDMREDGIGSLLVRIQTQIRELQLAISQPLGFVFTEVCGSLIALGVAFYYSWKLTLVICATIPVAVLLLSWLSRGLGPAIEAQKMELAKASKYVNTAITAINTVKAFNGQEYEIWQYCSTVKCMATKYLDQARANAVQFGITKFLMVGLFVQGFWYGLVLVRQGLNPGYVLTTFYACLYAMQATEIILPQWLVLKKGMSAGHTLQNIMNEVQKVNQPAGPDDSIRPEFRGGDIEIIDVSFAYPCNITQQAIKKASFFFPAGETTFVVGKSGSGKSTIGNLLMKYYQATEGEILLDGHSITDLNTEWLRKSITLVQQETHLFNETVLQNISFGKQEGATTVDIAIAAQSADLKRTIANLPEGYNTVVGSNGVALSGGQQQKVVLARARYRDTPILILDESTSALDKTSRERVLKELRLWRKGKTTIIITHDVAQIFDEDYVYVVEQGKVVEEGYRRKLVQNADGKFSTFVSSDLLLPATPTSPGIGLGITCPDPRQDSRIDSAITSYGHPEATSHAAQTAGHPSQTGISTFLDMAKPTLQPTFKSPYLQSNRFSLGTGFTQANMFQADERWKSPTLLPLPLQPCAQSQFAKMYLPSKMEQGEAIELEDQKYRICRRHSVFGLNGRSPSLPVTSRRASVASISDSSRRRKHRTSILGFELPSSRPSAANTSDDGNTRTVISQFRHSMPRIDSRRRVSIENLSDDSDSQSRSRCRHSIYGLHSERRSFVATLSNEGASQPRGQQRASVFGFDDHESPSSAASRRISVKAPSASPFSMHSSIAKAALAPASDSAPFETTMANDMNHCQLSDDSVMKVGQKKGPADDLSPGTQASLIKILGTIWWTLAVKDRFILVFGFLNAVLVAAATPTFAYMFSRLLSTFYITANQTEEARKWALILLGVAIIDGFAAFFTHYALEHCGQKWVNALRVEALKRILAQPKSWFDQPKNSAASLNEFLDRNAEEMRNLLGRFAGPVFTVGWLLVLSVTWSFVLSWKLTLVALASAPVMFIGTRLFHLVSGHWENKTDVAATSITAIFTETFSNIRVVRALTLEKYFTNKYEDSLTSACRIGIRRAIYSGILYGFTDMISACASALIFYYGAVIVSNGDGNVAQVLQVVNLLLFGITNSVSIISIMPQLSSSCITATAILRLASLPTRDSHEYEGTKRIADPFPIRFNSLNFTYPTNPTNNTSLTNLNLNILPGTVTALVGPSGGGKSTITSLLLGLYPPDHVNSTPPPLTFAETSISHLNASTLRSLIAVVPQTAMLFPTTILQNIIYGLPELSPFATLPIAAQAAIDAGIHDFIMSLENGYYTLIGDGGMGLSGGQAQRICIARALIRRPKLLILDEATSALDVVSAQAIRETVQKTMERQRGEMAVLFISHSTEMMQIADTIVVIENGRVVEQGSFDTLVRQGRKFARLVGSGAEGFDLGEEDGVTPAMHWAPKIGDEDEGGAKVWEA